MAYSQARKQATYKWRETHREAYNRAQRELMRRRKAAKLAVQSPIVPEVGLDAMNNDGRGSSSHSDNNNDKQDS